MPVEHPAPYVTLSFFQYEGRERLWGMRQMAEMRAPLKQVAGLQFHKLLGTGGGTGYDFWPDWGTYALLCGWSDERSAKDFHSVHPVHQSFRAHTSELYTLHLEPYLSRGAWSGVNPFASGRNPSAGPLAVLTRATIKPSYVIPFWKRVGAVARSLEGREGLLFTKGVGELPWVVQATFSVWRSEQDMQAFAYGRSAPHSAAVARTRQAQGFSEELYARFTVLRSEGTWRNSDPVSGLMR